jgi:1-deoxy-D-xylulose-5-phosphate reductoisomerase
VIRRVSVLGSTGSIGVNALEVVRRLNREARGPRHRVWALSAHSNLGLLKAQIREFRPSAVAVAERAAAEELKDWARRSAPRLSVWAGEEGLVRAASHRSVDVLVSAVVGTAGLAPLFAALKAGKIVALANKEALVVAGEILMKTARIYGAAVIPVDSEHSAMFQCLGLPSATGLKAPGLKRLILTASGGAFYRRKGPLDGVTPKEALRHPTWRMGRKITVDSATLTNKGLEAIEARHLFGVPLSDIQIVIHPQSIVHSLVEFEDGSMLAQMSHPDMRIPIQYALTHPERRPTPVKPLALEEIRALEFYPPNFRRFPCLALALEAGRKGGLWPAVMNAANEAAVGAFLDGKIGFTGIPKLIRSVLGGFGKTEECSRRPDLPAVRAADEWARRAAAERLTAPAGNVTALARNAVGERPSGKRLSPALRER